MVPSKFPVFLNNPLPSYVDKNHPLNRDPTAMAIWQIQDKQLMDCNLPFAELLGYDQVSQLILTNGFVTIYDLLGLEIKDRVKSCFDSFERNNVRYFERPSIFRRKDGTEIKVFLKMAYHGPHLVMGVKLIDEPTFEALRLKHPACTILPTAPIHLPPSSSTSSLSSSSSSTSSTSSSSSPSPSPTPSPTAHSSPSPLHSSLSPAVPAPSPHQ
eukprot:Phypoly_transcript_15125.p1 GENE.Phypoly_transcript_15125~~Phypoly_transcript_15125.p1  ORF type:complete len:213 (+),score=51.66 Phypoly_transcript_15125:157-795(+)